MYRKLAASTSEMDIRLIVEEMEDRYGPIPQEASRLLAVARLRHLARQAGITDIGVQGNRIKIHPVELLDSQQVRLKRLFPGATYRAVADFLSAMFNLDKVDVRGGHTKEEQPAAGSRSVVSFLEGNRPRR